MDSAQLADVVARAQRADPTAFDALVEAYSARLYGYFYRLTGARHETGAIRHGIVIHGLGGGRNREGEGISAGQHPDLDEPGQPAEQSLAEALRTAVLGHHP